MATRQPAPFDPRAFLANTGPGRSVSKLRKGQTVFSQGDRADAVYYVLRGKLKVAVVSDRGKEAVVSMLEPSNFFGEACMAGQTRRLVTVSALTDATVVRIEKTTVAELLHNQLTFSELFMSHVLTRSIRVEADLIDQLFNSSERRLARLLLLLANYGKEGQLEPILAKISQETLAEMIGTTRSRVSFFMNKFRRLGFIDYNGHIEVHKSLLNLVLHEKPHIHSGHTDA